jgi:hypothetical protein
MSVSDVPTAGIVVPQEIREGPVPEKEATIMVRREDETGSTTTSSGAGSTTTSSTTDTPVPPRTETVPVVRDRVVTVDQDRHDLIDVRHDPGVRAARDRFGGLDGAASLAGMLVALATLLLLAGIASAAIGAIAFRTAGNEAAYSIGALTAAGVVLFLSFLAGGWAAGRMARYSGAVNGFMVGIWFLILLAVLAGLGALFGDAYNLFDNLQVAKADLPDWFSQDTITTGVIVSSIAYVVVMFVGSVLGGLWGTRMHRRADEVIATGGTSEESLTHPF